MYQDSQNFRKTIGDVDVLYHEGRYHLFHLVLPNHDFVAHAVSVDGLNWRRVENALFIGHPGEWDDHMLWTMHVSRDPYHPQRWRMFYTGLNRDDRGMVQRIGLAISENLYEWTKVQVNWPSTPANIRACTNISSCYDRSSSFPLAAEKPHYESSPEEGRNWVSFRDPFYFHDGERGYLLAGARVAEGPVIRRGCVALFEEQQEGIFESRAPLLWPRLYDDIEVPNLMHLNGRYYLLGSIREDAKIRYWYSDSLDGPFYNFSDNVLLPAGNYAGRVGFDEQGPLIWCFYSRDADQRTRDNLMPPPKRLDVDEHGQLVVKTFERFEKIEKAVLGPEQLGLPREICGNSLADAQYNASAKMLKLSSKAGFAGFCFEEEVESFRFRSRLQFRGRGKAGLLLRVDPQSADGYYLSLDLQKGIAQLRAWGARPNGRIEQAFDFRTLQANYWESAPQGPWDVEVLAYTTYLECSINGRVLLSLADETYSIGLCGLYVESSCLEVHDYYLTHLFSSETPDESLIESRGMLGN